MWFFCGEVNRPQLFVWLNESRAQDSAFNRYTGVFCTT